MTDVKNGIYLFFFFTLVVSCTPHKSGEQLQADSDWKEIIIPDTLDALFIPDTIHLGRIKSGSVIRHDMVIRNPNSEPVVILSVKSSCGCTSVQYPKEPILPNSEAPFSFEFDSKGFSGFQLKQITIQTSATPVLYRIILVGEVYP